MQRTVDLPSSLPLTAFEEYMLRDDRPAYPMSIVARLRFAGALHPPAANAALKAAIARHPLLRAKTRLAANGRYEWVGVDSPPAISWIEGPGHGRFPCMRPIDLHAETGLRAWAAADPQQSSLVMQVHHAACDGKGVIQVLDDFVRGYAGAWAGNISEIDLLPCNPQRLLGRGRFGLTAKKLLRLLPAQLSGLVGAAQFLFRNAVPVVSPVSPTHTAPKRRQRSRAEDSASEEESPQQALPGLPAEFPEVKLARLSSAEVQRLSALAATRRATLNDWLLRDFFAAIADFRARHSDTAASDWIRILVPLNLREAGDHDMPAANVVSMVFLDRRPSQIARTDRLLDGIHAEMDMIRRRRLGLTFIASLCCLRWLPGGIAARVNQERCEATCVVSNMGRAMADSPLARRGEKIVAGNVVLEGIDLFSPVRAGTAVSVALVHYAGELQLCLHYDSRQITEPQADELMATYLRMIRIPLGETCPAAQGEGARDPRKELIPWNIPLEPWHGSSPA